MIWSNSFEKACKRHKSLIHEALHNIPLKTNVKIEMGCFNEYICKMLKAVGYKCVNNNDYYLLKMPNFGEKFCNVNEIVSLLELLSKIMVESKTVSQNFGIWNECNRTIARLKRINGEGLYCHQVDLMITQKCSLKCRDCLNLMQYYQKPINADKNEIFSEIDRLDNIFDEIEQLHILGGEPFMNKDIYEICQYAASKENFKWIVVFSNATIMPSEKITMLDKDKTIFYLSEYKNKKQMIEQIGKYISKNGINCYKERFEGGWIKHSNFEKIDYKEDEINKLFIECDGRNCPTVANGKLFYCEYLANAMMLGAIPYSETNFIDLNVDRECIKKYLGREEAPQGCSFCSRPLNSRNVTDKLVEAGVQLDEPLEYKKY